MGTYSNCSVLDQKKEEILPCELAVYSIKRIGW